MSLLQLMTRINYSISALFYIYIYIYICVLFTLPGLGVVVVCVCVCGGGGGGGVSEARGSTKRVLKTERVMFRYPIYLTFPKIYLRKCL